MGFPRTDGRRISHSRCAATPAAFFADNSPHPARHASHGSPPRAFLYGLTYAISASQVQQNRMVTRICVAVPGAMKRTLPHSSSFLPSSATSHHQYSGL